MPLNPADYLDDLVDEYDGSLLPTLGCWFNLSDQVGDPDTGGVFEPAYTNGLGAVLATGDTYPTTSPWAVDELVAAGMEGPVTLAWYAGQAATGLEGITGCVAVTEDSDRSGLGPSPTTEAQLLAVTSGAASAYLGSIPTAIASRQASTRRWEFYSGPVPANSATDGTTLDTHMATVIECAGRWYIDTTGGTDPAALAPPNLIEDAHAARGTKLLFYIAARFSNSLTVSGGGDLVDHATITDVADVSGNGNSCSGSATYRQTAASGGRACLRFNGTTDSFSLTDDLVLGSAWTAIAVVKLPSTDTILMSATEAPNNRQLFRFNETSAGCLSAWDGTNPVRSAASSFTADAWAVVRYQYDGTNCRVYVNGTEVASYIAGPAANSAMLLRTLGSFNGSSNFFDKDLAELVIYSVSGTTNQVQLAEKWLGAYYSITVAGSPTLPERAALQRAVGTYNIPSGFEAWGRRLAAYDAWYTDVTALDCFDGIMAVTNQPFDGTGRVELAVADPANWYGPTNIGSLHPNADSGREGRAIVIIINNGPTFRTRMLSAFHYTGRRCHIRMDFGGCTTTERAQAISGCKQLARRFHSRRMSAMSMLG